MDLLPEASGSPNYSYSERIVYCAPLENCSCYLISFTSVVGQSFFVLFGNLSYCKKYGAGIDKGGLETRRA